MKSKIDVIQPRTPVVTKLSSAKSISQSLYFVFVCKKKQLEYKHRKFSKGKKILNNKWTDQIQQKLPKKVPKIGLIC